MGAPGHCWPGRPPPELWPPRPRANLQAGRGASEGRGGATTALASPGRRGLRKAWKGVRVSAPRPPPTHTHTRGPFVLAWEKEPGLPGGLEAAVLQGRGLPSGRGLGEQGPDRVAVVAVTTGRVSLATARAALAVRFASTPSPTAGRHCLPRALLPVPPVTMPQKVPQGRGRRALVASEPTQSRHSGLPQGPRPAAPGLSPAPPAPRRTPHGAHVCPGGPDGRRGPAAGREGRAEGLALGKATRGCAAPGAALEPTPPAFGQCVVDVKQTQRRTQSAREGWRISITAVHTVAGRPASGNPAARGPQHLSLAHPAGSLPV